MSIYLKLAAWAEPVVHHFNDWRDKKEHRELCTRAGQLLCLHYPGWIWKVEIPPKSGMLIVRNLLLDPDGKYGYALKLKSLSSTLDEVPFAAGAFMERYEQLKQHVGGLRSEDINGRNMRLVKPEQ